MELRSMNIHAIIQARMNSQRFPGKSLYRVQGKPMLQFLIESLVRCKRLNGIVLATSVEPSDDPIASFCGEAGIQCFRGPLDDVAGRFSQVLDAIGCEAFVRVNGDSPLLDFRLVDQGIELFQSGDCDVVTNTFKRTFPKGESVEVVCSSMYSNAYAQMTTDEQREHVTSFFYENAAKFRIINFESGADYGNMQLSVDTPEDMRMFDSLILAMGRPHWEYAFTEIIALYGSIRSKKLYDTA